MGENLGLCAAERLPLTSTQSLTRRPQGCVKKGWPLSPVPLASIDVDRAEAIASVVRGLGLRRDRYDDDRFYPPREAPLERQLAYFAAMVSIDHRTSTWWQPFEGRIDGELYHGTEALYRLGRKAFDRGLFDAERLASLTPQEALQLLSIEGRPIWDLHTRVYLLRDLGAKALEAGGFSRWLSVDTIAELRRRLARARAYEDPVGKKALLLAKFLDGRGLLRFRDLEEAADVPVDNHVSRIAYRVGLVELQVDHAGELTREEDAEVREVVKAAWRIVAKFAGVNPFTLDDFLWPLGRTTCTREGPTCRLCPLREACRARQEGRYPTEHLHVTTWYY